MTRDLPTCLKRHLTRRGLTPEQYHAKGGVASRLPDGCAQLCQAAVRDGLQDETWTETHGQDGCSKGRIKEASSE
jgi:hypothetical protein